MKKFVSASNERQLSGDAGAILVYTNVPGLNKRGSSWDRPHQTLLCSGRGEVQFQDIVIEMVHTNTILGHTNSDGHKQYTCTPSGVATDSAHVLPICSHLNSSSDSREARTATIFEKNSW